MAEAGASAANDGVVREIIQVQEVLIEERGGSILI
jgi:hypothetical protein